MPKQSGLHPTSSKSVDPSSYRLTAVITSATGKERDITSLVTSFTVSESIFQQAVMAEMDVSDGIAMMEDLNITGNEKISVVIRRQADKNSAVTDIQTDWYILDVPVFSRVKPDLQVYRLRLISTFGLVSKFRRVDHALSGTPVEIIQTLYSELGITPEAKDTQTTGVIKYIPPRLSYANTIGNLLRKCVSRSGAPYFAYENFGGGQNSHVIQSYDSMVTSSPLDTYVQGFFESAEQQSDESFEEKRTRILEISSNLGFSTYKGMRDGAYVTRTHSLDLSTKSYNVKDFSAFDEKPPLMDKELVWNKDFNVSGLSPNNLKDTYNIYVALNTLSMADTGHINWHNHMPYIVGSRNSVFANLEQIEHSVRLYGDTRLTPGAMVTLQFPRIGESIPGAGRTNDELITGNYLIVSATHMFNSQGYFTQIKVRKDSVKARSS